MPIYGGGGSVVAAPISRALFDYWVLQRKNDPVLPPMADELKVIKRQKAQDKTERDAIRDKKEALKEQAKATSANTETTQ